MRPLIVMVAVCGLVCGAWGQTPTPLPAKPAARTRNAPAVPSKPALRNEEKLRYVIAQLDLSVEQAKNAEALVEVFRAAREEDERTFTEKVALVRATSDALKEAEAAGDPVRAEAMREELRRAMPGVRAEEEFYAQLESLLQEPQKAQLAATLDRLRRNASGELRPIDVVHLALSLGLSPEQQSKLDKALETARQSTGGQGQLREKQRAALCEAVITNVRAILSSEQAAQFDKQLGKMRALPAAPAKAAEAPGKPG